MPLPTIATPWSRNGSSALPRAMWKAGSRSLRKDSMTTGISAFGSTIRNGTNTPWSKPRAPSVATGSPAFSISALTFAATSGAPGAG